MSKQVVYVLEDESLPAACKIGKDMKWPQRFKQARSHCPGLLRTVGVFHFSDPDLARKAEDAAKRLFAKSVRPLDVEEWFNVTADQAIAKLAREPEFAAARLEVRPTVSPRGPKAQAWDDFREMGDQYLAYRWRLWAFQVDDLATCSGHPHVGRLKVTCGAAYDTAYSYNFTYNPFPVALVAGFEFLDDRGVQVSNPHLVAVWRDLVIALGSGPDAQPLGWLRLGATIKQVCEFLRSRGLRSFDLSRPKPHDACPKDASVPKTAIGRLYSLKRVRDLATPIAPT